MIQTIKRMMPLSFKQRIKESTLIESIANLFGYSLNIPYEPDVSQAIERIVKPNWVCADVGANIGLITLLLANLVGEGGKVIAFEVVPENAKELKRRAIKNGYAARTVIETIAVTDGSSKQVQLFQGRADVSAEWNIVGHDVMGNPTQAVMSVPAISLDDYFPVGTRLDFVKIDVEGAEGLVITGMRRLLREARPILIIEFHDEVGWAGRRELFEANYNLYTINGQLINPENNQRVYHCLAQPC